MLLGLEGTSRSSTHSGSGVVVAASEPARRRVVLLATIVYGLLLTEGALRKWVFPNYSAAIFFIRDPFVLWLYLDVVISGLWPRREPLLGVSLGLAFAGLLLAAIQVTLGLGDSGSPLLFAMYGVRNYFFYIPLAFIMGATFRAEDLRRIVWVTFLLTLPAALLVFGQFHAPLDAVINVGSATDVTKQFHDLGIDGNHIRPAGLFSSNIGEREFILVTFAMLVCAWGGVAEVVPKSRALLLLTSLALVAELAYSGSRGAVLGAGVVVLFSIVAFTRMRDRPKIGRGFVALVGFLLLAFALTFFFFGDGLDAFLGRWSSAYAAEQDRYTGGIFGRAFYGFIDFFRLIGRTPILGYGLGLGGNASTVMGLSIGNLTPVEVAETDWSRHIVDLGPILGIFYIIFRVVLVLAVWRRIYRSRSALAIALFGFMGIELLLGQVTGQGSVNGFTWLTLGFCLAAARIAQESTGVSTALAEPRNTGPRFAHVLR